MAEPKKWCGNSPGKCFGCGEGLVAFNRHSIHHISPDGQHHYFHLCEPEPCRADDGMHSPPDHMGGGTSEAWPAVKLPMGVDCGFCENARTREQLEAQLGKVVASRLWATATPDLVRLVELWEAWDVDRIEAELVRSATRWKSPAQVSPV